MGSKRADIERARKLHKVARQNVPPEEWQKQQETKTRRFVAGYLTSIRSEDHHIYAIGKHFLTLYQQREGVALDDGASFQEIRDAHEALLQAFMRYLNAVRSWPVSADGHPARGVMGNGLDYIPSAAELETRVPQHSEWNDDGTRKTHTQIEAEGTLDDAPTLREMLPEIPPGWEAIMQDRRRRYPEQYARKERRRVEP